MKRFGWLGFVFMLALGLSGCRQAQTTSNNKMNIVASVNFYGEVAQAVAGKYGHVTSLIDNPDIDPHDYEPNTAAAKTVAKADIVVLNGAGYDGWMQRLISSDNSQVAQVSAAKVVGVRDGENEHIWYKPKMMVKMANALAKALSKKDPAHRKVYEQNAAKYIKRLAPMLKLVASLKQGAKGQAVAVSEPVFDNTLQYLGYHVSNPHFAKAVEDSTDPSPADIRELEADLKAHRVAFFVRNSQVESKIVTNMVAKAKAAGVPIVTVTETMPAGATYVSWMTKQYQQVAKIQQEEAN